MPVPFSQREVQIVLDQVTVALKSVEALTRLGDTGREVGRPLALAITDLESARHRLRDALAATPIEMDQQ